MGKSFGFIICKQFTCFSSVKFACNVYNFTLLLKKNASVAKAVALPF